MVRCDECGSSNVEPIHEQGVDAAECGLCGNLLGDDAVIDWIRTGRRAVELGYEPLAYRCMEQIDRIPGLRAVGAAGADPRIWPFIQIAALETRALLSIENLAKSLALSANQLSSPWIMEIEYGQRLLICLKVRFRCPATEVTADMVHEARRDLERLRLALRRDMGLSWWRH